LANDGQIVFEVTADGKHAIADIKDITRTIQQETGKWDTAATQSTNNIDSSFSGMLKKLAVGFSAAKIGQTLISIGQDAVQAASDLQEVQNVVDVTFGSGSNKIEAWAKKAGTQFGLTETQAKRFTSTLGAMMKSSGLAGSEIVDMSTDLAGLAADMASFYNLDFDTAFQKIRSGISGETEPLKQLGINMSVANLEAYALKQGLSKTFDEMTQGEQTMLRYQYLMSATADAQGDFARTSDGYANSMRSLETNIESLKTKLGTVLLPIVSEATNALNGFLNLLFPSEEKQTTVLDDFADIDLNTEAKLQSIRQTATEANELTAILDKIGGSQASKAGSKVQQIVESLASIDLSQDKTKVVSDFVSTLANNIDIIAAIQGTDAEGAKAWLDGIAESANKLDPTDAEGWASLIESIKAGLPGFENTDFGASFFGSLGDKFSSVEQQSSVLQWVIDSLGNKTNKTAQEQALWLETCQRLVQTIPGLSSIINTETGEIEGGTDAVKEYVKAWEEGQTKLAMLAALEQKESALSTRFADLPELQLDMAVAEKRLRDRNTQIQALMEKYSLGDAYKNFLENEDTTVAESVFVNAGATQEDIEELERLFDGYETLVDEADKATNAYNTQADALKEAEDALKEYRETVEEMPGNVEDSANSATEALTTLQKAAQGDADAMTQVKTAVENANTALKAMADYAQGVRDSVASSVNSTTQGFEYIGNAAQRQELRLSSLTDELKELEESGSDLTDINLRIANAQDTYGIGNLTKNLQSQVDFLKEYNDDMIKAQEMGFSDEFLSQFTDGTTDSAEWLHELTNASSSQVTELNNLWKNVSTSKSNLTDTLTQQKLSVDDAYKTLAESAKTAVAELDLGEEAKTNAGATIQGIADGIGENEPAVATAVDGIINQLNRLNNYGINIDFGGFGNITFTTSTGKTEGSGRFGLDYVPHDDFIIRAHEGERLLTAQENQIWNMLLNGGVSGFDLETLGGVMRDNVHAGGNVYLDGKTVGTVISDRQGKSYKSLTRSGWQA
jgi:hypothetical protein